MGWKLLAIALAGSAGTLCRYGLGGLVHRVAGAQIPWGTVVVNLLGCFLFGLVWALSEDRLSISSEIRTVILVGFMGAFTTFSTFIFETRELLRDSLWLFACGNLLIQNVGGIATLMLGIALGSRV